MNRWVVILGIILVVLSTAYVVYLFMAPLGPQTSTFSQKWARLSPTSVQLIPKGFPLPYVIGDAITVQSGTVAPLSSTSARYRIVLTSSTPPAQLLMQYRTYFSRLLWSITTTNQESLTAQRGGNSFTVTASFAPSEQTTSATLEYIGLSWPPSAQ